MSEGLVFLLIGPSGSGKSSIIKRIFEDFSDLRRFTTYTTRPPRADEINGREYFFVSDDEFAKLREQGKLIEWQQFYGHWYGSSRVLLESIIRNGVEAIAAYDVLGSKELMRLYPTRVVTIFIVPTSVETLRRRLIERYGDDTPEGRIRLERFDMEMQHAGEFKHTVQNKDSRLEQAVADVENIIRSERRIRSL